MADELLRYVEEQFRKGYSAVQIRQSLINKGYSSTLVEGVMDSVSRNQSQWQNQQPTLNSGIAGKVAIGFGVALILVIAAIFLPKVINSGNALLDITANPDQQSYHAGDTVGFVAQIINMGSKERFDITLIYRVLDSNEDLITSKEETIAISTSTSYHKEIVLPPSMKTGQYMLKIFANYDGKVATSAFSFTVDPRPSGTIPAPIKNTTSSNTNSPSNNQNNQQPQPSCDDGIRNQGETGVDCGGPCAGYWYDLSCHAIPKPTTTAPKSTGTLLLEARMQAKSDPDGAKETCLGFSDELVRDSCLKSIAQASMRSDFCELVIKDSERDLCYYPFFMKGDYTVCEKLVLKESLETCAQLKQISEISSQSQTNTNSDLEAPAE